MLVFQNVHGSRQDSRQTFNWFHLSNGCNRLHFKDEITLEQRSRVVLRQYMTGHSRTSFGMFRIAWRTPRSPKTSSAPPRILSILFQPEAMWQNSRHLRVEWHSPMILCDRQSISWLPSTCSIELTCSICSPIPVLVMPRPPNIWTASLAVCWADCVACILRRPMGLLPTSISYMFNVVCSDIPSKLGCLFLVALQQKSILRRRMVDEEYIPSDSSGA